MTITPEGVRGFFDANAVIIMFIWGILHTRVPFLAKVPNSLVPWVNCVGYILAQLAVPAAHAGLVDTAISAAGVVVVTARGAVTSALTSLLYDKFVKDWLDRWLPVARIASPAPAPRKRG